VRDARLRAGAGGEMAPLTDERVPTLEEALEEARGRVFVNIDTKFPRELPLVIATVRRLGAEGHVIIKSDVEPESGERVEQCSGGETATYWRQVIGRSSYATHASSSRNGQSIWSRK